jgi:hypothetical protein
MYLLQGGARGNSPPVGDLMCVTAEKSNKARWPTNLSIFVLFSANLVAVGIIPKMERSALSLSSYKTSGNIKRMN